MRKVRQGLMLAAGVAAAALLTSCSGRTWMAQEAASPPARSAEEAGDARSAARALASGRFADAAALNAAALAFSPENRQAQLGYALAQLGLGQTEQAAARLRALAAFDDAPNPDVGLALALAGEAEAGVAILERAATLPNADARTRQNLALALALADDWRNARTLVERDAGRAQATRNLTRWAVWAALPPQDRLAGFLGVVPVRAATTTLAHAEPPLLMAARAADSKTVMAVVEAGGVAVAETGDAVPDAPVAAVALAAVQETAAEVPAPAQAEAREGNGWVVQLAAVRHVENLEAGWHSLQARYPSLLARYTPHMTQGRGWSRLSIGDFNGRAEAMAECQTLRRRGIDCFARKAEV